MRGYFGALFATCMAAAFVLINLLARYTNPVLTICAIGLYIGVAIAVSRNAFARTVLDIPTLISLNTFLTGAKVEAPCMAATDVVGPLQWETYPIPDQQPEKSEPNPDGSPGPKLRSRASLEPSMVGKYRGYTPTETHEHEWVSIRTLGESHDQGFCVECSRERYPS